MSTKLNAEELAASIIPSTGSICDYVASLAAAKAIREVAQPIADERDELRKALEAAVEVWEPLLCEADLTAAENPAWLAIQRIQSILAKYPKP